jgi:hypothetical protein
MKDKLDLSARDRKDLVLRRETPQDLTYNSRRLVECKLPIMDSLRNQLTAPSEEILGTLAAMQAMVSHKSGAYG